MGCELSLQGELDLSLIRMAHQLVGPTLTQDFSASVSELTLELTDTLWGSAKGWFSLSGGAVSVHSLFEEWWADNGQLFLQRLRAELGLKKVTLVIRGKTRSCPTTER